MTELKGQLTDNIQQSKEQMADLKGQLTNNIQQSKEQMTELKGQLTDNIQQSKEQMTDLKGQLTDNIQQSKEQMTELKEQLMDNIQQQDNKIEVLEEENKNQTSAIEVLSNCLKGIQAPCAEGFTRKGCLCYKRFTERKTWADAQTNCERLGATLAQPKNAAENTEVQHMIQGMTVRYAWLGGNDVIREGKWMIGDQEITGWTNWWYGQPQGGREENAMCMYQDDGTWHDCPNTWGCPYVCQQSTTKCLSGFTPIGNACYKLSSNQLSFDEAVDACNEMGTELAQPSYSHYGLLRQYIFPKNSDIPIWMGIRKQEGRWAYLSADKDSGWLNGRGALWSPVNPSGDGDCVEAVRHLGIFSNPYTWNDKNCAGRAYYVCQQN